LTRPISDLFPYQQHAVEFQCARPASALWLDMGLGKSVITLTSIDWLINSGTVNAILIVAPIRVCRLVWRQEALKWTHTRHLKFSMVMGEPDQRMWALLQKADIYMINYENLEWLVGALRTHFDSKGLPLPFNGIVFDEITKCKNSSTARVKALLKMLPAFVWRTGLTGTPAGNGYKDLHGQYLVLDDGKRLGTSKTAFEGRWFKSEGPYKKVPYADTEQRVKELIGDMTLEMSEAEFNPLPDMVVNNVEVQLPTPLRKIYETMEREYFIKLDSGAEVEMFNKASLTNKCLQFANGAMYPIAGMPELWEPIHDLKLDALEDIIEEANGKPILCSYSFRSDAERIMSRFHNFRPINLTECKSERALKNAMQRWAEGNCRLMIGHPASMGHGIDALQNNGHILVWYGLNWSLDLYSQFNARLRRQGQGMPVICHRILCEDTLDQAQAIALDAKAKTQTSLRNAIRQYRQQKRL